MFNQPSFKYALLVGDVVSLGVGYFASLSIVFGGDNNGLFSDSGRTVGMLVSFGLLVPLMLFIYLVNNLYKRQTFRSRYRHLVVLLKCLLIGIAVCLPVVFLFSWEFFLEYGRNFILSFVPIAFFLTIVARLNIVRMLVVRSAKVTNKRRLLVVGGDDAARSVVTAIQRERQPEFEVIGLVDDYKEPGHKVFNNLVNLGRLDDVPALVENHRPDEILIAIDKAPYFRLVHVVEVCLATGCIVRIFSDRLKILANRLGAEQYARGIPVIMLSQVEPGGISLGVRRVLDIVISLTTLIALSPFLLAVCLVIKLSSPGPVVFRQTRIGLNGRPFDFYKFRSMHVGTSSSEHEEFVKDFIKRPAADNSASEGSVNVFKIEDDPRIFPFGRFIRRTSIDEFPQLVNVLKGEMGLVGPRPCLPYEWESYDDWHKERLSVVPGCTGLWQVLGRSVVTFEEMVIMDLYYISNYSIVLDARILYKTIPVIFFAKGGF